MQSIRLPYYVTDGIDGVEGSAVEDRNAPDVWIHIKQVYPDDSIYNWPGLLDGIGAGCCHRRIDLDRHFTDMGWHLVSDVDDVLTYAGPLRPMPVE